MMKSTALQAIYQIHIFCTRHTAYLILKFSEYNTLKENSLRGIAFGCDPCEMLVKMTSTREYREEYNTVLLTENSLPQLPIENKLSEDIKLGTNQDASISSMWHLLVPPT